MIAADIPPVSNLVIRHRDTGAYARTGYVDRRGDHPVVHAVLLDAAHQPTVATLTEEQLGAWEPGSLEAQIRQQMGWDDAHRVAAWLRTRYSGWYPQLMDAANLTPDWVDAAIDYLVYGDRSALQRI